MGESGQLSWIHDRRAALVHTISVEDAAAGNPAGNYRIVVNTSPPTVYKDVRITGGAARVLDISDG